MTERRIITPQAFATKTGHPLDRASKFLEDWHDAGVVEEIGDGGYELTTQGWSYALAISTGAPVEPA